MAFRIVLACLLVAMATATESVGSCVVKGNPDFRPDPDDCSVFYVCANDILYKFNCSNSVFDPVTRTCVGRGSTYDTCTKKDTPAQTVICLPGSRALIPHPENCAQYYNCSDPKQRFRWPEHLRECPYPQLYNVITKQCEHYSMVKCGDREQPISHCDYRANQCQACSLYPLHRALPKLQGSSRRLEPVGREGRLPILCRV
ncbi:uncharacterized protein LOC124280209 [Haliotis rubra]|uniref:uncharacterized protein LOC124280209 n=1 Tax=Haliotis rubra TaxID=36100 RepID=UPI001EE5302A|nr:uncharacterized protein LOC124280209 [Haliotis rubra]